LHTYEDLFKKHESIEEDLGSEKKVVRFEDKTSEEIS
jgi:hypothetical protein